MKTVEQIKEAFVKEGWSKNIMLTELTKEESKNNNLDIKKRYFKMEISGNIFDENCKIVLYNI